MAWLFKTNTYNWFIHPHSSEIINQPSLRYLVPNGYSPLYLGFCLLFNGTNTWVKISVCGILGKAKGIRTMLPKSNLYLMGHLCSKIHLLVYTRPRCIHGGNSKKSYGFINFILSGNMGPIINGSWKGGTLNVELLNAKQNTHTVCVCSSYRFSLFLNVVWTIYYQLKIMQIKQPVQIYTKHNISKSILNNDIDHFIISGLKIVLTVSFLQVPRLTLLWLPAVLQ